VQPFTWNYAINTDGIVIDFDPTQNGGGNGIPTGNFNLKITTTVAGASTTVNVKNIPKPSNQEQFCAGQDVLSQLPNGYKLNSCTFDGNVGNMAVTVSQNGFSISYAVKYEYSAAS
ncbi:MAG: carboxypeptidase regulatory-like domain-containing protein, partial [Pseudomonadota bacterium]|nr:carboxypeptidase regulatory-like domain-containing protein [Pseudomonadota bacterium]